MKIALPLSLLTFIALNFLVANQAHADAKEFFYKRHLESIRQDKMNAGSETGAITPTLPIVTAGEFDQRINHNDPADTRTFKQRFYVDSKYAVNNDAPVIYIPCGEATCTENELLGYRADLAKKLGAQLVALEHRYYGKSQPFPILSTENMKYLTTDMALKDLAAFQKFAMKQLTGKWIIMGGSYAGSLSAFYRLKYPSLVQGSLASSAPVQARDNFEEYDLTVSQVAGPDCAAAMRKAVAQVEATLNKPAELLQMKKLFNAEIVNDNVDFMYVIADMGAIAIQYGMRDFFCNEILSGDALTGYASAGKNVFQQFGITAFEDSFQAAESTNPDDYLGTFGMRAWLYQSCTEYGYWQTAYHDPAISVRSSLINLPYHNTVCERLFGLKNAVDPSKMNNTFYHELLDKSVDSIFFTNGSTDPWSKLSISQELGNAALNPNIDSFTIPGAAHCDDLGTPTFGDSKELKYARTKFESLVAFWLR